MTPEEIEQCWARVRHNLYAELRDDIYFAWFIQLQCTTCKNGVLRISTATPFLQFWLKTHYRELLVRTCVAAFPDLTEIYLSARYHDGWSRQFPRRTKALPVGSRSDPSDDPVITQIIEKVCVHFAVRKGDLSLKSPSSEVRRARDAIMYLARLCGKNNPEIAAALELSKVTVSNAIKTLEKALEQDAGLNRQIEQLQQMITVTES